MNIAVEVEIETRIMDAKTRKPVKVQKKKNLILDAGLNVLAKASAGFSGSTDPNKITTFCLIGSGNTANSIGSGSVTFTQSGTTITASSAFFASNMVGAIFKYGTGSGGTEVYITAFTSTTQVTVATSATVSTPTVATVWFVARTNLDTFLFSSGTYQTLTGDCGTTLTANTATHKRTFIFAQQASPYTVNEVGYAPSLSSNHIAGRLVLPSSDVVGINNFYVVVINFTVTYLPATPVSVTNVGTNINTAGTLAIECLNCGIVTSNGGVAGNPSGASSSVLDDTGTLVFKTATYTQNGSPSLTAGLTTNLLTVGGGINWVNDNTKVGSATMTFNSSVATTGQSLFGIGLLCSSPNQMMIDILFTATQTAPTGTFQPNTVWRLTYTRVLVN